MEDKYIIVPVWMKKLINDILEKEKPVKLLDLLKHANASRNKQQHRMTSDSKKGRQFISDPNKFTGQGKPIDTKPEPIRTISYSPEEHRTIAFHHRGPDSKTDI